VDEIAVRLQGFVALKLELFASDSSSGNVVVILWRWNAYDVPSLDMTNRRIVSK
jgi:hypothetical protein